MVALTSSKQLTPLVVSIVFAIIPTIAVVLRVVCRRLREAPLNSSDYTIFVALLFLYGLITCDILGVVKGGVGRRTMDIIQTDGPGPLTFFLQDLIAIQILWALSLTSVKVSILLFYNRIFEVPAFQRASKFVLAAIVLWALSVILCGFLLCRPFAFNWDQTIPGGSCGNQLLSYKLTGALNIVTDVAVLSLPLPMVFRLQVPRANKIALLCIFSLGFFICGISIVRLVTLVGVSYDDITYSVVDALIWSMLEPSLGVTLACLPMLRPLFTAVFPSLRSADRQKTTGNSGSGAIAGIPSSEAICSKGIDRMDEQEYPLRQYSQAGRGNHRPRDPYGDDDRSSGSGTGGADVESQQWSHYESDGVKHGHARVGV